MLYILHKVNTGRLFRNIIKIYIILTALLAMCYFNLDHGASSSLLANTHHETNVKIKIYYKAGSDHGWHEATNESHPSWHDTAYGNRSWHDKGNEGHGWHVEVADVVDAGAYYSDSDADDMEHLPMEVQGINQNPKKTIFQRPDKHDTKFNQYQSKNKHHIPFGNKTKWIQLVNDARNLYNHKVIRGIEGNHIFYLTAVASNTTPANTYDRLVLNGWESDKHIMSNDTFYCCLSMDDATMYAIPVIKKVHWDVVMFNIISATQFICQIPRDLVANRSKRPRMAGLIMNESRCSRSKLINITYAEKKPRGSIGVCAKVVYGQYPADRIIEWFEVNKLMGVNHIMMFTYNVSEATRAVMTHYAKEGLLTTQEFDYPMKMAFPRQMGQKYVLAWHDEQVPVFDCLERFYGYNYVAVLDIDEFLVPKVHTGFHNWNAMLNKLNKMAPEAAGFTFHTEIFTLNWGVSNPDGEHFVTQYIKRTRPMWDRRKSIIIPNRVERGSVWTHSYKPRPPFKSTSVSSSQATIMHYRSCRPHWVTQGTCTKGRNRYTDLTMTTLMSRVGKRIQTVKDKLIPESKQLLGTEYMQ